MSALLSNIASEQHKNDRRGPEDGYNVFRLNGGDPDCSTRRLIEITAEDRHETILLLAHFGRYYDELGQVRNVTNLERAVAKQYLDDKTKLTEEIATMFELQADVLTRLAKRGR